MSNSITIPQEESFRVRVRKKAPSAAAAAVVAAISRPPVVFRSLGHKEKVNHLSREPPPPPSPTQINRPD